MILTYSGEFPGLSGGLIHLTSKSFPGCCFPYHVKEIIVEQLLKYGTSHAKKKPTKTAKPASCSLQSSLGTDRTLPSLPFASVQLPRSLASRATPGANDVGAAIGAWRLHVGAMIWKRADSPEDFWNGNF